MLGDFDRSKFSRTYVSAPDKPDGFDKAVIRICGYAHSHVPRCRVRWGMDLTTFRNGNPKAVKYPPPYGKGPDRWILEPWRPPEFFGTELQWNDARYAVTDRGLIDRIGPFPRNGMYIFGMMLCAPDGSFLPCDQGVLDFIEMKMAEFQRQTWNVYKTAQSYAQLQEEMANEEAMEMAAADAEADEMGEYYERNKDYIERNPAFTFGKFGKASLWTPEGERPL